MSKSLQFPEIFNEKNWVKMSLKIESVLNSTDNCEFDLSRVEWADPIPILSLCLTLRRHSKKAANQKSKMAVTVVFNIENPTKEHRRFLCFLNKQGFLLEIIKYSNIRGKAKKKPEENQMAIGKIDKYNEPLKYKNTDCIKAKIIELSSVLERGGLDSLIDNLMDEAVEEVSTAVDASWSFLRDHAIQKLRHFSSELIENIIEHAYEEPAEEAFAIYARVRSGRGFVDNNEWNEQREKERNNCYLIGNWDDFEANDNSKWVEIFIVDNGGGLFSHIDKWKSDDSEANKLLKKILSQGYRPLRDIGHKIFVGGYSKQERPDIKTKMTGLQLVHETLSRKELYGSSSGEFIRLLTGNEVMGGHLPFGIAQARETKSIVLNSMLPIGTVFHACIEISDTNIFLPEAYTSASESQLQTIRSSFLGGGERSKLDLFTVDQRYLRVKGESYDAHRRPSDVLNSVYTKQYGEKKSSKYVYNELDELFQKQNHKHLVWLPPDSVTKKDIKAWISYCLCSSLKSLIIADIPLHRARIFEYIASSEEIESNYNDKHLNIFIITRNWHIASYCSKLDKGKYYFKKGPSENLRQLGLDKLSCMLRENDSKIFWGNVIRKNNSPFVKEPIIWESEADEPIQGYLDFGEATSNAVNHKIIKAALERAIALFKDQNILLVGVDELVMSFSSDLNVIHDLNHISDISIKDSFDKVLLIGSICVTGSTGERIRALIKGNCTSIDIDELYILKHPSYDPTTHLLRVLDWEYDAEEEFKQKGVMYERLEGTPYIKRGGAKSYKIDRHENPSSPYEMYREFSQGHLKLGHWEYANSHDLLTPNLSRIIATNPAVTKWFCDEAEKFHSDIQNTKNYLIYISHGVTCKLIESMLKTNPKLEKMYEIHSLQKLNISSSQHVFFSPIVLEKIQKTSLRKVALNIVLIDDGVISGTTLRNAEANLIHKDSDDLITLSIIDRIGFSSIENLQRNRRITRKTYWSWDVPSLGKSGHCRLCHNIETINAVTRGNPNEWIKTRSKYWGDAWKLKPVTDQGWGLMGVPSQVLNKSYDMKFGQPHADVTHTNSTTLSSMSIEISNSSFQPEFPLRKFYKDGEYNEVINKNVALEVLTTHIFLLGDGLTPSRKLEYYTAILETLWKCDYSDQYTALAGLIFVSIEDSLKQLVWREICRLINQYGFRYKHDTKLEDLELVCLALIIDLPNAQEKLKAEIENSRGKSSEAFLFLLSLVQNKNDLRRPMLGYYRVFGPARGKWHQGLFEESIMNAYEILATKEIESRMRIKGAINEAIDVISELDKCEFICHHDARDIITKLECISADLMENDDSKLKDKSYIQDKLINSQLFEALWDYAQSTPDQIAEFIKGERRSFSEEFAEYYKHKKEDFIIEECWGKEFPEVLIEYNCRQESAGRYVFFKPFRDFIRDAIYNSIWGLHGIKDKNGQVCAMLICIQEKGGNLVIEFSNLSSQDKVKLHSKAYHTLINVLNGDYSIITDNGVCKSTITIPPTSNYFSEERFYARSCN